MITKQRSLCVFCAENAKYKNAWKMQTWLKNNVTCNKTRCEWQTRKTRSTVCTRYFKQNYWRESMRQNACIQHARRTAFQSWIPVWYASFPECSLFLLFCSCYFYHCRSAPVTPIIMLNDGTLISIQGFVRILLVSFAFNQLADECQPWQFPNAAWSKWCAISRSYLVSLLQRRFYFSCFFFCCFISQASLALA